MRSLLLVALAAAWLGGYALACAVWPFAACGRCDGTGKRRSPSGKAFRACPRCKGTARRLRTGRRFWLWTRGRAAR
ncbi:hypothetical protein [Kineosporia sp. A_224]|uniref:hypothetical protein n=1 Tax=Kineosporia sp. A_224 TaxID=1962180 RepID=UPI0018E96588|nr:hypothetical protein [Kineosporia sp. A_224]